MTVRGFSGARIFHSVGDLATILAGPFTLVVQFRRKGSTSDGSQVLWSMSQGGSFVTGFGFNSSSAMNWTRALTASWGASGTITNAKDYVAVMRYQGDGTAPILKLKNLTDNTTTAWLTSGTSIDADVTSVPDELQSGNRVNDFPLNGNMGGWAVFEGDVGATVGDTFLASYQAWFDATPVAMHVFNQTGTPPAATNDLFDGTHQTSQVNTTSVAGEDPANFDSTPPTGGGTDLPYDGEGETLLLNDTPASYSQTAAYAADTRAARLLQDTPARGALAAATNTDQRAGAPVRAPARGTVASAGAADAVGGRPVPGLARSVLSIEMGADAVGARPVIGLASYELTESGAQDLAYDALGITSRALPAPVQARLDEMFQAIPRPPLLADMPARGALALDTQADARGPFVVRNAAARVLANQALFALLRGGWPARGLAVATMGSGEPLPVDVVAEFGPVNVSNGLGPIVVKASFGGSAVQGWTP